MTRERSSLRLTRERVSSRTMRCHAGGIKLGRKRPCWRRSAIHSASLMSVFLPGTALMWLRIDHHHLQMPFQDIEDGSPEHARTFHRYLATLLLREPIAQTHEICGHGAKGPACFAAFAVGRWGDEASHDCFLVDIQACASFVHDLHKSSPLHAGIHQCRQATGYRAWVKCSHTCFALRRATDAGAWRYPGHTVGQAHSASVKPTFDVGPALAQVYPILFHGLWCAPAHELLLANSLRIFVRAGVERGPLQSPFGFASSSENNCNTRRKKGTWHIMEVNRRDEKQEPERRLRIVQMSGEPAPTKTSERSHALDTRLQGRWLLLARGIWLALVILTLAIFGASLPVYVALLQTPCAGIACRNEALLTPEQASVLKEMGLSTGDYAAYTVAFTLASVVVCLVVSTVIIWRRSDDRMALIVALLLVTLGSSNATSVIHVSSSPWQVPNAF